MFISLQCAERYGTKLHKEDLSVPVTTVYTRAARRSVARTGLVLPSTRRRLGNRAFCVAGPAAWNSLPFDIRTASILSTFKNRLKTHLFLQPSTNNLIRVAHVVQRLCSDFTDTLRRLINCGIIIIFYPRYQGSRRIWKK